MKMNGQMSSMVCQFLLTQIYLFSKFLTCYVADPAKRKQFKQFVNTSERRPQIEIIEERGQQRPVNWPHTSALKLTADQLKTPKNQWTWVTVAKKDDITLSENGTTNFAVKYGDTQLAVFHVPKRGFYATQQM
jgi:nitrite reductase (NAD(P)H)